MKRLSIITNHRSCTARKDGFEMRLCDYCKAPSVGETEFGVAVCERCQSGPPVPKSGVPNGMTMGDETTHPGEPSQ